MLNISEEFYLGSGLHKAVYVHPNDVNKVIKIPFEPDDAELKHELAYRKSRKIRHLKSDFFTEYFGTVDTNLGKGYVFERVLNADGSRPETMREYLDREQAVNWKDRNQVQSLVRYFMKKIMEDRILTNDTCMENFLLQRDRLGNVKIRIIDNIGSPVKIPLVYYLDCMTCAHIKRYLKRFCRDLENTYPGIKID